MFLDAVLNDQLEVVYNSIPMNVKKWLLERSEEERASWHVYDGERLRRWTVGEYLTTSR